jgi:transmembrane sensor
MEELNTIEDFLANERFSVWLKTRDSELTKYWAAWLSKNSSKRHVFEAAVATFRALEGNTLPATDTYISKKVDDIKKALPERRPLQVAWWRPLIGRAAILIGILGAGGIFWLLTQTKKPVISNLAVKPEKAAVESLRPVIVRNEGAQPLLLNLPDNSSVLLTHNSTLEYIDDSKQFNREVKLTGEAFFEVVKMPNRPFLVQTNTMTTRVLGTSFLIRSFDNEAKATVRVRTGKVQVTAKDIVSTSVKPLLPKPNGELKSILLMPNQQATLVRKTAELVRDKQIQKSATVNPQLFDTRNFVFRFTPMLEVFTMLEKAYGTRLHFDRNRFKNCTITADLTDEPFLEKLKLICASTEAHFEISESGVNIFGNGCP